MHLTSIPKPILLSPVQQMYEMKIKKINTCHLDGQNNTAYETNSLPRSINGLQQKSIL